MNAAEYKTTRDALGLTVPWLSQVTGVNRRTLQYWEYTRVRGQGIRLINVFLRVRSLWLEATVKKMKEEAVGGAITLWRPTDIKTLGEYEKSMLSTARRVVAHHNRDYPNEALDLSDGLPIEYCNSLFFTLFERLSSELERVQIRYEEE